MPSAKRTQDDVVNDAMEVYLRNQARKNEAKKESALKKKTNSVYQQVGANNKKQLRAKAPVGTKRKKASPKKEEQEFLPTSSSEEDESVRAPAKKKRKADPAVIAKQMFESGELFGHKTVKSKLASTEQKTPLLPQNTPVADSPFLRQHEGLPTVPQPERLLPRQELSPAVHPTMNSHQMAKSFIPREAPKKNSLPQAVARRNVLVPPREPAPVVVPVIARPARYHQQQEVAASRGDGHAVARNEIVIEDVTDDDDDSVVVDTESEEWQPQNVPVGIIDEHQPAVPSKKSVWIGIVSLLVAVASVLVAVLPSFESVQKFEWNKLPAYTVSWTLKGLASFVKAVLLFLWRRLCHVARTWWNLLQIYPLSTGLGTMIVVWVARILFSRTNHRRREAAIRQRVLAIRSRVHNELYKSSRPVGSEIIFARIAYEEFPISSAKRNQFKKEIWSIVEAEVRDDPRIVVSREQVSGRPMITWNWVDPGRPT